MDNRTSYTRTAISLHWLIALLIFGGWSLGLFMADLPASPDKLRYFSWHKWTGVTIFLLVVLRLGWRATHPAPALPEGMPRWQLTAAHVSHFLLYLLMLAIPLSGWLMSSAKGVQTVYFGVLPLPDLLAKNPPLGSFLADIHELLAWTLAGLVGLHTVAAFKHHFIDRDAVLRRMLPMLAAIALLGGTLMNNVSAARSEVRATFTQMSVPIEAEFRAFEGAVAFDPKHPDAAKAKIEIDTASFDIGSPEYNDEVRKKEWFDSAAYPRATFVSSKVTRIGVNRYLARGTLTLKGKAAEIEVPFTLFRGQSGWFYQGEFPVSRKSWSIGDKDWDPVLDDRVVVAFRIATTDK